MLDEQRRLWKEHKWEMHRCAWERSDDAGIYPTVGWIRRHVAGRKGRFLMPGQQVKVIRACLIGSTASGHHGPESDLDFAVVVECRGVSALKATEWWHSSFTRSTQKRWGHPGRIIDLQFYSPDDPSLATFDKVWLRP